ncbi:MAG: hypothetical protein LBS75_03710 [Synergistaceae bacterium]|jgi:hypothetical protein|nr:hypothetical protein [Synergistaceae bacterium]
MAKTANERFGTLTMNRRLQRHAARRLAVGAICALLAAASLALTVFVLFHANHDHDSDGAGGGCLMCAQVTAAQGLLRGPEQAGGCAVFTLGAAPALFCNLKSVRAWTYLQTLTALKIQLNR